MIWQNDLSMICFSIYRLFRPCVLTGLVTVLRETMCWQQQWFVAILVIVSNISISNIVLFVLNYLLMGAAILSKRLSISTTFLLPFLQYRGAIGNVATFKVFPPLWKKTGKAKNMPLSVQWFKMYFVYYYFKNSALGILLSYLARV